ncbi:uncharacterized protein LOC120120532 [Hibiscus syriacus]|uniref:uncharacterized protein LOC120120532 n=1 Tax=Hibiscus syriacus TaxID=106335 RepID=UPI001922C30A|nr:uncharacterized protein LOC120120532 [Hibiscus syriacus]
MSSKAVIRRVARRCIREILDGSGRSSVNSPNSRREDKFLEEAEAVWEVSNILQMSLKGGKEAVIERVRALEEGLRRETKLDIVRLPLCRNIWGRGTFEWAYSPAEGLAGGLLCLWDSNFFKELERFIFRRLVVVIGQIPSRNVSCGFINVYGPSQDGEKVEFFRELNEFMTSHSISWCVRGDFNSFIYPDEKIGAHINVRVIGWFRNFIQQVGLVDLPLVGGSYTCRCQSLSSHNAVLLEEAAVNWGKKPFRCFNFWLDESSFSASIKSAIKSVEEGDGCKKIGRVLKATKVAAREWFKEQCFDFQLEIGDLESKISVLEQELQNFGDNHTVAAELRSLRCKLWEVYRKEERSWLQKSRVRWISEGDRNTSFFHNFASSRRRTNSIVSMLENGVRVEDPISVKSIVQPYFRKVYDKKTALEVADFNLPFSKLEADQVSYLESKFSEDDIFLVLMNSDGKPRVRAIFNFFKKLWPDLKEGIVRFFDEFYNSVVWTPV